MARQQIIKEERSLGDLFSDLANDTGILIKQEVALAQTEIVSKASEIGKNVGFLAVGGAVGFVALLAFVTAAIAGLANFIPLWLSAIIIGAIIGVIAFLLISSALATLKNTNLKPRETVQSLKEDAKWLKDQVS
jgi:hypothetical protein